MIRLLLIIVCVGLFLPASQAEVRNLIIVDISKTMAARKEAAIEIVRELISSGFDGQMRDGDKYGIWLYNEENYWNRLPLQIWEEGKTKLNAEVAAQFIASEKFEKRAQFEKVAADIDRLLSGRPDMLINIITDGESILSGIDFDIELNSTMSERKAKLGVERKPFLISLLALQHKIRTWKVYSGSGELGLPKLPVTGAAELAKSSEHQARDKSEKPENDTVAEAEIKKKKKEEEEKPPIVMEMPPGARILAPKHPEPVATAAVIENSVETKPVVIPSLQEVIPSNPEPTVVAKHEDLAERTNIVAVASSNDSNGEAQGKGKSEPSIQPKHEEIAIPARIESSATGPLFYCIAAIGFLLPIAVVLMYLQRRANNRGSIISQSILRDFKSSSAPR